MSDEEEDEEEDLMNIVPVTESGKFIALEKLVWVVATLVEQSKDSLQNVSGWCETTGPRIFSTLSFNNCDLHINVNYFFVEFSDTPIGGRFHCSHSAKSQLWLKAFYGSVLIHELFFSLSLDDRLQIMG